MITSRFTTGFIPWDDDQLPTLQYWECMNVYTDILGQICRLPFDGKRPGVWKFDGQVFWLP